MLGILVIEIKLKYQFWIALHCWAMAGRLVGVEKSKRLQLIFLHYLCDFCLLGFGYAQVHGQSTTDLKTWRSRQGWVRSLVAFFCSHGCLGCCRSTVSWRLLWPGNEWGGGLKDEQCTKRLLGRTKGTGHFGLSSRTFLMEQKCSLLHSALCYLCTR